MIQNQHQYKITNSKLKGLELVLLNLANNPTQLSERLWQSQQAGVQVWIDRLKTEIIEYDLLQTGQSSIVTERVEFEKKAQLLKNHSESANYSKFDQILVRVPANLPIAGDELE